MENLASQLEQVETVAIAGHVRPDGDCIGSCMGLYLYLKENEPDIKCDVYLEAAKEGFSYIKNLFTFTRNTHFAASLEYTVQYIGTSNISNSRSFEYLAHFCMTQNFFFKYRV